MEFTGPPAEVQVSHDVNDTNNPDRYSPDGVYRRLTSGLSRGPKRSMTLLLSGASERVSIAVNDCVHAVEKMHHLHISLLPRREASSDT